MNVRSKKLLDEVMELPVDEREEFAADLLAHLGAPLDNRTDEEWSAEIERRARGALAPDWRGATPDEVRTHVESVLRQK